MKILKKLAWVLLLALVIAQLFGPEKNDGDLASLDTFMNETNPTAEAKIILKQACFDCHSDKTKYPWYSNITPLNYWLDGHIDHGKGELNFSAWAEYSAKKKDHKLEEVIDEVKEKHMPLNSYTWVHREAKLTDDQIKALVDWANTARLRYALEQKPE